MTTSGVSNPTFTARLNEIVSKQHKDIESKEEQRAVSSETKTELSKKVENKVIFKMQIFKQLWDQKKGINKGLGEILKITNFVNKFILAEIAAEYKNFDQKNDDSYENFLHKHNTELEAKFLEQVTWLRSKKFTIRIKGIPGYQKLVSNQISRHEKNLETLEAHLKSADYYKGKTTPLILATLAKSILPPLEGMHEGQRNEPGIIRISSVAIDVIDQAAYILEDSITDLGPEAVDLAYKIGSEMGIKPAK